MLLLSGLGGTGKPIYNDKRIKRKIKKFHYCQNIRN
jgi:hypothetical protein